MKPTDRVVILIADHEELVRDLITRALQSSEADLLLAPTGRAAMKICMNTSPPIHLAFLDIGMHMVDGLDLTECLRDRFRGVRMVFMSANPQDEALHAARLLSIGGGFLLKPFTMDELRSRAQEELARAAEISKKSKAR